MQLTDLTIAMRYLFRRWFHKRNIIIVSEHKVKHIPVSGAVQFSALMLLAAGVCWASYSTGSFVAARHALKEQSQTLRSVTNARIESALNPLAHVAPPEPMLISEPSYALPEPMVTPSALEQNKLVARVAVLESKVTELRATNEAIIQRVRDKASDRIDDLESLIRQTGLNPASLKKEVKKATVTAKLEGGPYIPSEMIELPPSADQMLASLDELAVLREIIGDLPLGEPIRHAEEQSAFGHRIDPFTGRLAFHSGLDLAGPYGTSVHATAEGTVVAAGKNGAYGNAIDISHGFGLVTRYGHLREISVKNGQQVKRGDLLGIQGTTGRSTGSHLHYEVRYYDRPMNPKKFLSAGRYVPQE